MSLNLNYNFATAPPLHKYFKTMAKTIMVKKFLKSSLLWFTLSKYIDVITGAYAGFLRGGAQL